MTTMFDGNGDDDTPVVPQEQPAEKPEQEEPAKEDAQEQQQESGAAEEKPVETPSAE